MKKTLAVATIALGALIGALAGGGASEKASEVDAFLARYTETLRLLATRAPTEASAEELVYSSIDGMLDVLDPHTNFLPPEAFAAMRERQQGSFHGIGVIISLRGGRVTVISPIADTPAARVGLRAGDIIDTIDGTSTEGMSVDEAARRLRGPEGTSVRVGILRPGLREPFEVSLTRAKVPTESIRNAFLIRPDTAYVRISDFTRSTGAEFRAAITRLTNAGATKLLLDLRDNPGGIVDSAVEVASVLLAGGQQVFSTKGRTADSFQDYRVSADGLHFAGPLVVLVNRGSASAAEIVAGAIQDHDRGLLAGEVTFGKGVVQTIFPVRDAGLALTTAKYYTPSGRCIQRGYESFFDYVHPESEAEPPDTQEPPPPPTPTPPPEGPVYFTDAGRRVFGGGGIVPDHPIPRSELSSRMVRLLVNSAFFHFAVDTLAGAADKEAAARSFVADEATLARFRERVVREGWLSAKEMDAALADPRDRAGIVTNLTVEVLSAGVSMVAGYEAAAAADPQIQAALDLFEEARQLQARSAVPPTGQATAALRPPQ
jgi:carboxyl-terminal processing protease